jgi:hypothetical protein
MHQVCRKSGQCCPHFHVNRNTVHVYCLCILFTCTVYHCSSSVDNIVHTRVHIVNTFKVELQCHVTHFYLKHCTRHDRKCGQFCPYFGQIVHTFWGKVHCSHKTLFTYLTKSVDMSTLSGEKFTVHIKHCLRILQKV